MNYEKENNEEKNECGSKDCINCHAIYRCTNKEMNKEAKEWNIQRLNREV